MIEPLKIALSHLSLCSFCVFALFFATAVSSVHSPREASCIRGVVFLDIQNIRIHTDMARSERARWRWIIPSAHIADPPPEYSNTVQAETTIVARSFTCKRCPPSLVLTI
jgi:hypothetical protein